MKCPELVNSEILKIKMHGDGRESTELVIKKSFGECVEDKCSAWGFSNGDCRCVKYFPSE